LLAAGLAQDGEPASSKLKNLGDKTLVAWVALANLSQRGGSALTLIAEGERFDAIVFGEIAPGRWMAGSDFFRRTERNQAAYADETADARTFVQIAIAYKGARVAIFRNGKSYRSYRTERQQTFGPDASVLVGLRYVGGMGTIGFLAGAVEEVRVYDVALDAGQIARLKPNQPSDPRPIGLWTFENGSTDDAMGTFPRGQLCGGARIADGKLHLNGSDAYMISESTITDSPGMFYKARSKQTGNMWDTWLYFHEGTYYLYYLAKSGRQWDNISLATSSDGVHWKEHGRVLAKARGVTWMGTGSTWRSPDYPKDGKFQMNFSEWRGPRQTIFFAESTDLVNWTRLGPAYEFKQDERWYEPKGRWDCIYTIPRPGGGLYGYWTATPQSRGRFGFGQSRDGVTWEALEPPETPDVHEGEAGAVEKIGDRYYMMFGTGGLMITLVADKPQGPFVPAKKNLRLLSGHTYFSRFFPAPDGILVTHHAIARNGQVYCGQLKRAVLDEESTLRLGWWEGNEKLKHEAVEVTPDSVFDTRSGVVLEGRMALPGVLSIECVGGQKAEIRVGEGGVTELGSVAGGGFKCEKRVDRQFPFGKMASFRLLMRYSLLECYLDDILIECFSLPDTATGRIVWGDGITDVKAWQ
jgi:hypothetical protein